MVDTRNNKFRDAYARIVDSASGKAVAGARVELVLQAPAEVSAAFDGSMIDGIEDLSGGALAAVSIGDPVSGAAAASSISVAVSTTDRDGLVKFPAAPINKAIQAGRQLAISLDGGVSSVPVPALDDWLQFGAINIRVPAIDMGLFGRDGDGGTASDALANWGVDVRALDLSPGIFPGFEDLHFGDDACSRLVPNDKTMRSFDHSEIIVRERNAISAECADAGPMNIHAGEILYFEVVWTRLGYTFGELLYSLALAPGEHVTLAVSSWEQRQLARLSRDSVASESATANSIRSSSLNEVMNLNSSSFRSGLALGIPLTEDGNITVNAGVAYDRTKVAANASRQFSERIQQNANRIRQDRQTIVAEQVETEDSTVSYRAVCNRNYCHSLNMFFHEVLENHRVVSYLTGHRKALLVPHAVEGFDAHRAFCTHGLLKDFILDDCIDDCCESLKHVLFAGTSGGASDAPGVTASGPSAKLIQLQVSIGSNGHSAGKAVSVILFLKNGSRIEASFTHSDKWRTNSSYTQTASTSPFDPADVTGVALRMDTGSVVDRKMDVVSFTVSADHSELGMVELATGAAPGLKKGAMSSTYRSIFSPPAPSPAPLPAAGEAEAPKDHEACVAAYVAHLNCHKHYYNALLWMLGDPNERITRFEKCKLPDGRVLSEAIDPTPLGVWGDYVAFAAADAPFEPLDEPEPMSDRLVVLPSSGVFADIALGQCTSCETLPDEDDPFWKVIDKPNHCEGAKISPKTAAESSLLGENSLAFAAPPSAAWATLISLQAEAAANSLNALVQAAVAKELDKKLPTTTEPKAPTDPKAPKTS